MALGKFAVSPLQAADASLLRELPRYMRAQVEPRWRAHKWLCCGQRAPTRTPPHSTPIYQRFFVFSLVPGLYSVLDVVLRTTCSTVGVW